MTVSEIKDLALEYSYDFMRKEDYTEGMTRAERSLFNAEVSEIRKARRATEFHEDSPSLDVPWFAFK